MNEKPVLNIDLNAKITDKFTPEELALVTYKWEVSTESDGNFKDIEFITGNKYTVETKGTYRVTASTAKSCSHTDNIFINYGLAPTFYLGDDIKEECITDFPVLDISINSTELSQSDITEYQWEFKGIKDDDFSILTSQINRTITANKVGTYRATATAKEYNGNICDFSDEIKVDFNRIPEVEINDFTNEECTETLPTLTAWVNNKTDIEADGGKVIYQWQWKEKDTDSYDNIPGATNADYTVDKSGYYQINVSNFIYGENKCIVKTKTKLIKYAPKPTVTINTPTDECNNAQTLTAEVENKDSFTNQHLNYQWSFKQPNETVFKDITGATNKYITANKDGWYKATVYSTSSSTSNTVICSNFNEVEFNYKPLPEIIVTGTNISPCSNKAQTITVNINNTQDWKNGNGQIEKYEWYKNNVLVKTTTTNALTDVYSITETNKYKVVVTTVDGCTAEDEKDYEYEATPIFSLIVSNNNDKCTSEPITITANITNDNGTFGAFTYNWVRYYKDANGNDQTLNLDNHSAEITVTENGTYSLIGVPELTSCNSAEVTSGEISFKPIPEVDINFNAEDFLCSDTPQFLTAEFSNGAVYNTDFTYKWYKNEAEITTGINYEKHTLEVNQSGEYKIVVENECGTFEDTKEVVYTNKPEITVSASNNENSCTKEDLILTVKAENGTDITNLNFKWFYIDADNKSEYLETTSAPNYTITKAGKYSVQAFDTKNNCNSAEVTINVNYQPTPIILSEVILPTDKCSGEDIIINATLVNNHITFEDLTYVWTLPNNTTDKTSGLSIIANQSGEYTLTATTKYGCNDTTKQTIKYYPIYSNLAVNITGNANECTSTATTLTANVEGDYSGTILYKWFKGNNTTGETNKTISVTESNEYEVEISIKDDNCNVASDKINVNYLLEPTVVLNANTPTGCTEEAITLTADVTPTTLTDLTYLWTLSDGSTKTTKGINTIKVFDNGNYKVQVSTPEFCSGTDETVISEYKPNPIISSVIKGPNNECSNDDITIIATLENKNKTDFKDIKYTWTVNGNKKPAYNGLTTITATENGEYILTADFNDCKATTTENISIKPIYTDFDVKIEGNSDDCTTSEITLEAKVTGTYTGNVLYQWQLNEEDISGATSKTISVTESGNFTINVSIENDVCNTTNDMVVVNYNPEPIVEITVNNLETDCMDTDTQVTLTADITNSTILNINNLIYKWTLPNGDTETITTNKISIKESGKYIVEVSDKTGASICTGTDEVEINYFPEPKIDYSVSHNNDCNSTPITINTWITNDTFNFGTVTYQWYKNNVELTDKTETNITVEESDIYKLIVTAKHNDTVICTSFIEKEINYNPIPEMYIEVDGELAECSINEITLIAKIKDTSKIYGDVTYTWKQDGSIIEGEITKELIIHTSGLYTVEAVTENGNCSSANIAEKQIDYTPAPRLNVTHNVPKETCTDEQFTITAKIENPNEINLDYTLLTWELPNGETKNGFVDDDGVATLKVTQKGIYKVTAIDYFTYCSSTENVIDIDFRPLADFVLNYEGIQEECTPLPFYLTIDIPDNDIIFDNIKYFWTKPDNTTEEIEISNDEIGTTIKKQISQSGNHKIEVRTYYNDTEFCTNGEKEIDVEYKPLPIIYTKIEGLVNACTQEEVKLNAIIDRLETYNNTLIYSWYLDGDVIPNQNETILTVHKSGEYIFMAETTDGCTASDTVNVDYRPEAKIIPRIEGTIHICTTEPVTIHADINDNIPKEDVAFIWTKPDGTVIANYYESSLVVTQSGTYKVSSIATNGGAEACLSDDAEITIDFKPVPNIELNLSADAKNCSTNPIMLEVGITDLSINYGELTYFWTTPYTAPNEFITTTKPTLEALAKGTYTVYAENKHGCPSNSSNYDVTILPQPKVVINTEGEKELCSISYPTLSADLTNGDIDYGNLSYIWKHSETKDGTYTLITDGIEKELIIDKNGWYSVVVNTEKGCESEQAITYIYYEIKPDITLSIKNETTECTDEPVILTIDAGNSENLTFLWEVPYGTGKVLTTENTLTVHKTGKYTVTAYTTDGCSSNPISEDVVYNRNPKIELVIDGTVDKCTAIGDVKLLVDFDNAKDSAAYQNLVYTWTTPYNGIVTTKVPVLKVNQNGTYKVKVTTENNCDGYSEEINVNFMPNPEVFLVTDDINSICTNEEVYIEAYTVDIDESMTLEYTWTTPSNKTIITDVAKIKALENGIYKVEVSNIFDKLNCNSKEATIPVSYLPKPLANIEAQNITCSTDQATLTANITNIVEILNRADNITYQWWRTDLEYNGSAEMIEEGTVIDSIEGVPTLSISKDGKYDIILIANYPTSSTYPDGKKCDELISETINVSPMPLITMNIPTASDCHDYGTTITVNLDNYEILNDANEIETLTYTWLIDGVTELNYNEDSLRVSLLGNHSYQVIVSTPEGCVATADVEDFNYKPSPSIELTDLIETCEYDTPLLDPVINADIDPTLIKYTWTNKSGTVLQQGIGEKFRTYIDENIGEIVNIQSFTYNLKTEYEGCINTADVVVTYNPEPEFDLPESIQLCEGESVKIVADKSPYNNAVISWFSTNIKDSIISDEITVSEIGTYHATATLGECVYSSSVEVDILKYPKFRIETPSFNCNEKTLSLVAIPFNIDDTYTYKWSNGTNSDVTEINSGGEYIVEASNGKCSVSKSVYIKDQYFDTSNSINSVGFCVGGSTELTPEYDYESIIWNDGSTKPTLFVDKAGTYTAKAVNSFGCEDELIFEVYVDNGPEINNVEVNENNILVTVNEGVSPYRFFIENKEYYPALNNGKYEIENNFTEGNHIITVIDYNECDATNEFLIKDKMTTIDILSPNGDGVNDTWHVKELELYPKSMVRIYDRYGRLVHKVPGIDLNWDGRFEGNLLPASDYWYHIDLYADGKITYTGHFSLIR
ncbi:MAG: T9SS type B sorting domain-containing protein [Ichthyobacteriaceae bacterium]|nr:T9SS type B sorting domain-containing protein [Ichthyobacteriaceae bacterium]